MVITLPQLVEEWLVQSGFEKHWIIMDGISLSCITAIRSARLRIFDDNVEIYNRLGLFQTVRHVYAADPEFFDKLFQIMKSVCLCTGRKWYRNKINGT